MGLCPVLFPRSKSLRANDWAQAKGVNKGINNVCFEIIHSIYFFQHQTKRSQALLLLLLFFYYYKPQENTLVCLVAKIQVRKQYHSYDITPNIKPKVEISKLSLQTTNNTYQDGWYASTVYSSSVKPKYTKVCADKFHI